MKKLLPDSVQWVTEMKQVVVDKGASDKAVADKAVVDKVVVDNKLKDMQNEAKDQDLSKKCKSFGGKIFFRNYMKCTIATEFPESKYELCLDDSIISSFI